MKKIAIIACLLGGLFTSQAQKLNEVKWNVFNTIAITSVELGYEFYIDKDQSVVARHITNVFKEGELEENSNMQILHNTFSKYKPTKVYSLDVIISVGYRVKSKRGTAFRIWARGILTRPLVFGGFPRPCQEVRDTHTSPLVKTDASFRQSSRV